MTEISDLLPTDAELLRLRRVAAGEEMPDLVVRGGLVQSPATEEWLPRDILVAGRHIAALTPWGHVAEALAELDVRGCHVVPGFIDAHLHVEYTNLTPGELGRLSIPRGTTTVLTDPNAAANVWGAGGMDFMLATGTPLHVFQQVSPTTPTSAALEHGGVAIPEEVVHARLRDDVTVTLGESNPFDLGEMSTARFRAALAAGRRLTGHTASQTHESLWSYLAAGISDDHNASTIPEVLERVRLGAMVTVMGASLTDNTVPLFSDLDAVGPALRHMSFCADDKNAFDMDREGHIDHHVRQAIRFGVDPQLAYRMATTQPAHYYRLDQVLGILAPSRLADLLIIPNLAEVRPSIVIAAGQVVGRSGRALFANDDPVPEWTGSTVRIAPDLDTSAFAVSATGEKARVRAMEMYDGYFKREFAAEAPVVEGNVVSDPRQDLLKVAVVDRHLRDGSTGIGFVRGFGLRSGAIASTMNCTNMNIIVVGADDASMLQAVEALAEMGGGFVAVDGGKVVGRVRLEVGGMMSASPFEETVAAIDEAQSTAASMGCPIASPFIVLSFVGLYLVPDLGITELGLIDAATQRFVDVLLPDTEG